MPERRLTDPNGQPIAYTCHNRRFETDISRGHPHLAGQAGGSVTPQPLVLHGDLGLWLEHVIEPATGAPFYWFMWYDAGTPTIPLSGIFNRDELSELASQLAQFVP